MVILAALPGIVSELLVNGKLVKPGNFSAIVNFLGSRIRKVGLARRPSTTIRRRPRRRTGRRSVQEGAVRLRRELGTAEAQVVVPVRGLVVVAVRRAHVLRVVVPRAAPDQAVGRRFDRHPKTIRLHPASRLQMSPGSENYALFNSIARSIRRLPSAAPLRSSGRGLRVAPHPPPRSPASLRSRPRLRLRLSPCSLSWPPPRSSASLRSRPPA